MGQWTLPDSRMDVRPACPDATLSPAMQAAATCSAPTWLGTDTPEVLEAHTLFLHYDACAMQKYLLKNHSRGVSGFPLVCARRRARWYRICPHSTPALKGNKEPRELPLCFSVLQTSDWPSASLANSKSSSLAETLRLLTEKCMSDF